MILGFLFAGVMTGVTAYGMITLTNLPDLVGIILSVLGGLVAFVVYVIVLTRMGY